MECIVVIGDADSLFYGSCIGILRYIDEKISIELNFPIKGKNTRYRGYLAFFKKGKNNRKDDWFWLKFLNLYT